ncbi:TPA: hypothetical protein SMQ85_006373 [Pseudomonas aeruginosa]|nr:hypothetical protein [Pseudomonas aeruginosa]
MNDYKSAFNAAAADISAIIALLGFTKYPGVDPVLRAIADLILEKAESQVLREERDAANKRADTLEHRMMGMMTRHFAEAWHNRDTQKALDGYLSAGIAQLEQAEQAEAERPEVVGVRYEDGTILSAEDCGTALEVCAKVQTPLMTVAQHERIVGALRFERQQMDRAFTACINERDAADARLHEVATACATAEEERDAALARVAELERQQPVAWMHDQPNRVDVIHRDVKDLLQRVPGSSRGIYRPLDVSEHYTIPLYAAPVAQAQHSVPEISGIGRDAEHPRAVVLYLRNEPSEEDMRAIQNFLRAISADVLTQAQHSAGYAEARQCVNCRHIGINDAADYAACHDCRWTGPEPDEDKCPGCAGENCMAAACPECGAVTSWSLRRKSPPRPPRLGRCRKNARLALTPSTTSTTGMAKVIATSALPRRLLTGNGFARKAARNCWSTKVTRFSRHGCSPHPRRRSVTNDRASPYHSRPGRPFHSATPPAPQRAGRSALASGCP